MFILNWKISVRVAVFLFCLGTGLVGAETIQAVVLDSQGDRVVINRGTDDGVRVGQTWILGLDGKTGAVVIDQAREHSASGRLHGKADVGSLASLGTEADAKEILADARAKEQMSSKTRSSSRALTELRRKYKRAISARTESRKFSTQIRGTGGTLQTAQMVNLGVEAYNTYRLYDLTRDIGLDPTGYASPWWIAASAVNMVGNQVNQRRMYDSQRQIFFSHSPSNSFLIWTV